MQNSSFYFHYILLLLALGCTACVECPSPSSNQEETEIISEYLIQPNTNQAIIMQRSKTVTFTNVSSCYVFRITNVGYEYLVPWASEPKVKVQDVNLAIPPNGSVSVDVTVPLGAQLLSVYSMRNATQVKVQ